MRIVIPALAKLNLALEVLHKREDGFHELRTVFQTISLGDTLHIEFTPSSLNSVHLESNVEIADNLAERAAWAFLKVAGITGTVHLHLHKQIPMGGGLGGGSTDAAAVLRGLAKLTGETISLQALIAAGAALGSDVPFFLLGGTALGTGRGTELYPLTGAVEDNVLLITPQVHSATKAAFSKLARNAHYLPDRNRCAELAQALALGGDWTAYTANDFEPAMFLAHPEIAAIYELLQQTGARTVRMTGSGSALFAVYPSKAALTAAQKLLESTPSHHVRFMDRQAYLLR